MKAIILICGLSALGLSVQAQDSSRKKEVNITSTFKPSLKEAAKINFNATPPAADTTRPRLQYNIPNQNLVLGFTPGTLKPLALQVDTGGRWGNDSYLKIGYGNFKTPFAQAGVAFGDGKNVGLNIYAKHHSSTGKLAFQEYSNSAVDLNTFFKNSRNMEWNLRFGGFQENYKKYGFEPKTLNLPDDSLDVKYMTWRGRVGFHNINKTEFGLSYAPEVKFDLFNDGLNNSEGTTYFQLPLQKSIGESFAVDLSVSGSLSRYKRKGEKNISNNFFAFAPSILFKKPNANVQAGIRPSWDNGNFKLFPNVLLEFKTQENEFSFQVGWTGYLRNAGFQYAAGINPWIWKPATVYNSKIEERYLGIKGTLSDHFSYSGKMSYNLIKDQPLFTNDTSSGRSFLVVNEPDMKVFNIGGELGYTVGEKFSVISNLSLNRFKTEVNEKAWGLLPLEWKTSLRVQVLQDLYVNSTLYAFDGPLTLTKAGRKNLPAAMDLSAGLEFKVVKNIKLWAQFNNIFNKEYQRWNQYPVYGFNFLGGVVFSFAQKN